MTMTVLLRYMHGNVWNIYTIEFTVFIVTWILIGLRMTIMIGESEEVFKSLLTFSAIIKFCINFTAFSF